MSLDDQREITALREQVSGLTTAIQIGFESVKKDIHYLGKLYIPLTAIAVIALLLALLALIVALDNRAVLLTLPVAR